MGYEPVDRNGSEKLSLTRWLAFCVVLIERLWRLIWPAGSVFSIFLALCWFGLFAKLSFWWHVVVLWGLLLSGLVFLTRIRHLRLPQRNDIDRRIELQSGLKYQPLESQTDHLPPNHPTDLARIIWREHQRRMADTVHDLEVGTPQPGIPECDPFALRSLCILLACLGFCFSFGKFGGSVADAFRFVPIVNFDDVRMDAWVNPPTYTHQAPIYLSNRTQSHDQPITVPAGSEFTLRVAKNIYLSVTEIEANGRRIPIYKFDPKRNQTSGDETNKSSENDADLADTNFVEYKTPLRSNAAIDVRGDGGNKRWVFDVKADVAPTIRLTDPAPKRNDGSLELNYQIDDQYGATKAWVEMQQVEPAHGHALVDAPTFPLVLPSGGKGKAKTVQDIFEHPWAGSEVSLRLVVEDGAGQRGYSSTYDLILPQHIFGNPLARALVEQRRLLATNSLQRNHVLDMLAALMIRPQQTINNLKTFLFLQSAWTRLSIATNDNEFRDVVGYMWQIAEGIEGNLLNDAAKRLHQAQAALRDALRHGASSDEIKRLTENLRQAMRDYTEDFARNALKNNIKPKNLARGTRIFHEQEIEELLKKLEALAETGDQLQSEEILAQLEELMNHLQLGNPGEGGEGSGMSAMQHQLDKLSDLMQRQQKTLDKTHELQEDNARGAMTSEQNQKTMDELKKQQQDLSSQLRQLQLDLDAQGLGPTDSLKDAEHAMANAENALGEGRGDDAGEQQKQALAALRKSGQGLVDKMKQALNMDKKSGGSDPLGRAMGSENQQNMTMPGESDLQRARRILNEIRKRLGDHEVTPAEKQYLERLLQYNE